MKGERNGEREGGGWDEDQEALQVCLKMVKSIRCSGGLGRAKKLLEYS